MTNGNNDQLFDLVYNNLWLSRKIKRKEKMKCVVNSRLFLKCYRVVSLILLYTKILIVWNVQIHCLSNRVRQLEVGCVALMCFQLFHCCYQRWESKTKHQLPNEEYCDWQNLQWKDYLTMNRNTVSLERSIECLQILVHCHLQLQCPMKHRINISLHGDSTVRCLLSRQCLQMLKSGCWIVKNFKFSKLWKFPEFLHTRKDCKKHCVYVSGRLCFIIKVKYYYVIRYVGVRTCQSWSWPF